MPETPHIKRFEEWLEVYDEDPKPEHFVAAAMLNDLAEHVERFEARLSTIEYNLNMVPPDPPSLSNP